MVLSSIKKYLFTLNDLDLPNKPVTEELKRVFQTRGGGTESLAVLRKAVGQCVGKTYAGEQEDANEFLTYLLQAPLRNKQSFFNLSIRFI